MNEYFKIKKKTLYLICIVVLVIAAIVTVTVLIVNYNARPKPPVYELKLYDDNWEELEKNSSGDYLVRYKVAYDGTMKGFNAICYMDGKEFFRYDYHYAEKYNRIPVSVDFRESIYKFPTERGEYHVRYAFNTGLGYVGKLTFQTPLGEIKASDLPSNITEQVILEIV